MFMSIRELLDKKNEEITQKEGDMLSAAQDQVNDKTTALNAANSLNRVDEVGEEQIQEYVNGVHEIGNQIADKIEEQAETLVTERADCLREGTAGVDAFNRNAEIIRDNSGGAYAEIGEVTANRLNREGDSINQRVELHQARLEEVRAGFENIINILRD